MSQRFGSVVSYVRIGSRVLSPTFSDGEGDYLLGLELLESVRALRLLKPGGLAIVADTLKQPVSATLNREVYEEGALLEVVGSYAKTLVIPARRLASEAGNPRALNMVALGAFYGLQNQLSDTSIKKAISEVISQKWIESSIRAFELGVKYVRKTSR